MRFCPHGQWHHRSPRAQGIRLALCFSWGRDLALSRLLLGSRWPGTDIRPILDGSHSIHVRLADRTEVAPRRGDVRGRWEPFLLRGNGKGARSAGQAIRRRRKCATRGLTATPRPAPGIRAGLGGSAPPARSTGPIINAYLGRWASRWRVIRTGSRFPSDFRTCKPGRRRVAAKRIPLTEYKAPVDPDSPLERTLQQLGTIEVRLLLNRTVVWEREFAGDALA